MFGLGTTELLVIAIFILVIFGGRKIPELMKGLGKGIKEFKNEMNSDELANKAEEKKSFSDNHSGSESDKKSS